MEICQQLAKTPLDLVERPYTLLHELAALCRAYRCHRPSAQWAYSRLGIDRVRKGFQSRPGSRAFSTRASVRVTSKRAHAARRDGLDGAGYHAKIVDFGVVDDLPEQSRMGCDSCADSRAIHAN